MARIVDYQPLPTGGFSLTRDDGVSLPVAFLPPQVKAEVDAQRGPDNRLADASDVIKSQLGRADQAPAVFAPPEAPPVPTAPKAPAYSASGLPELGASSPYQIADAGPIPRDVTAQMMRPKGETVPEAERVNANVERAPQMGAEAPFAYRPPPTRVVKGGKVKTDTTIQRTNVDPDDAAKVKRAYQNEYEANAAGRDAQALGNASVASVLGQVPQGLEQMQQEQAMAEQARQQAIASDMSKMDQLRQDARQEVDPQRIFRNMGTPERFMTALAVGLSRLGAGMSGQKDSGLDMFYKRIDDDIAAQKQNIVNAQGQHAMMRGQLADNLQRFGDARRAEAVTRAQYLEWAQAQVTAAQAQAKTPEQKAAADAMLARLQRESSLQEAKFSETTEQIHTRVTPAQAVGGAGGGWSKKTLYPNDQEFMNGFARARQADPKLSIEDFKRSVSPGGSGAGGTPAFAKGPLAVGLVKEEQFEASANRLGANFGLERDKSGKWISPSLVSGVANHIGNAVGSAIGTDASFERETNKALAASELATLMRAGGVPDVEATKEANKLISTNNPRAIAATLNQAEAAGKQFRKSVQKLSNKDLGESGDTEPKTPDVGFRGVEE